MRQHKKNKAKKQNPKRTNFQYVSDYKATPEVPQGSVSGPQLTLNSAKVLCLCDMAVLSYSITNTKCLNVKETHRIVSDLLWDSNL